MMQGIIVEQCDITPPCRRVARERRQTNLRSFLCALTQKRRKKSRRYEDRYQGFYVDWHEPALFAVIFLVLLFCVGDAFFTLHILNHGGEELNPFMKFLLERDVRVFFYVKYFLTSSCILLIVAHKRFRILGYLNGYHILSGVFIGYTLLLYYELIVLYERINAVC